MFDYCPKCGSALPRAAVHCPRCGVDLRNLTDGADFRAWRLRVNQRLRIVCIVSIPIGLLFLTTSPVTTLIVSGLALLGTIVTSARLSRWRRAGQMGAPGGPWGR